MDDKDYIRKAVEIADDFLFKPYHDNGFRFLFPNYPDGHYDELIRGFDNLPQWYLDALAAQLVRQVDGYCTIRIQFLETGIGIVAYERDFWVNKSISEGPDRTMNAIKAIVDSGVLTTGGSNDA